MSLERLLRLSLQFAEALAYLHAQKMVHRYIRVENILLNTKCKSLVVSDLELVAELNQLRITDVLFITACRTDVSRT